MTAPGPAGQALGAPQQPAPPAETSVPAPPPSTSAAAGGAVAETAAAADAQPAPVAIGAAAIPPAPGGPSPSEEPSLHERAPQEPAWRARRHRRLHRLRIGQHVATDAALARLHLTSASVGLLVGWNQAGGPVALPMFQPDPIRVVLIGGAWATTLIAFRSLRFGARLVVFTDDPTGWITLGRRATGRTDRVAVQDHGAPVRMVASADQPVLQLSPSDATAPAAPPGPAGPGLPSATGTAAPAGPGQVPPWTTRLSVVPQVTTERTPLIAGAEVVLTQRLAPAEAAVLAPALRLNARTAYTLQVLHDDMLAVLTPAGAQYAWINPTSAELDTLGQPHRY